MSDTPPTAVLLAPELDSTWRYGSTIDTPPVRPQKSIVRVSTSDCDTTLVRMRAVTSSPSSGVTEAA